MIALMNSATILSLRFGETLVLAVADPSSCFHGHPHDLWQFLRLSECAQIIGSSSAAVLSLEQQLVEHGVSATINSARFVFPARGRLWTYPNQARQILGADAVCLANEAQRIS